MPLFLEWVGPKNQVPRDRVVFGNAGNSDTMSFKRRPYCGGRLTALFNHPECVEQLKCSVLVPFTGPFDHRYKPEDEGPGDLIGSLVEAATPLTNKQRKELIDRLSEMNETKPKPEPEVEVEAEPEPEPEPASEPEPEPEVIEEPEEDEDEDDDEEDEDESTPAPTGLDAPADYKWLMRRGRKLIPAATKYFGTPFKNLPMAAKAFADLDPPKTRAQMRSLINPAVGAVPKYEKEG